MTSNFIVYLIGYVLIVVGVGYAMSQAGIPSPWIIAVVLVLIGLGIIYAFSRSQRDEASKVRRPDARTDVRVDVSPSSRPTSSPDATPPR